MNEGGLPPTPRRISQSRQRGDSGVSVHLARSVAFCGFVVVLPWTWQGLQDSLVDQLRRSIDLVATNDPTREALGALRAPGTWATWATLAWSVPGLLLVLVLSTAAFLVQTGGTWALRRPLLRWPGSGWDDRPESPSPPPPRGGFAACRTLCFGLALATGAYAQGAEGLLREASRHHEAPSALLFIQTNTVALLRMGALAALVAGTLDFLVVRWAWRGRLAMSRAEVRQEQREVEGFPERKSAPRQRHKELTEASLQDGASPLQVLVTAAAWGAFLLRRDESPEGGPRWLLETRTQGRLARKLLELGRDSGVSIVVDQTMARRLSHLTPGDHLPTDLADVLEAHGWPWAHSTPSRTLVGSTSV